MHRKIPFTLLLLLILLAGMIPAALAQGPIPPDEGAEGTIPAPGLDSPAGIEDVSWRYEFSSSLLTYTEITTGTVHGTASNDDNSFNAIPLGFTFIYDGVTYTEVSIQSNGFIAMGPSVSSSYTPISTGSSNNVVAAVGRDIEGNDTTSELRSLTEGTAPNRVFTVQWKHYRRYGSTYTGDDWNFQIKLYETSGVVEVVYGPFAFHDATVLTPQVGLRGASNADFNNRMTDATHFWANSLPGTSNASTMGLSSANYPASGLTYDWGLATGLVLTPETQINGICKGGDAVHNLTLVNLTAVTTSFSLVYTSTWTATGPSASPVLAPGEEWDFQVSAHIPWSANAGDQDTLMVGAYGAGDSAQATATTIAALLQGWQDVTNATPRPVRAPSVVYWDGKLFKIGGYDGAARDYLDIYDIGTDTWTQGAPMPGVRYWLDCEAIADKIYCAGGYSTSGQTTLYIYDIATDTWSTGAALPAYRYSYASAVVNGLYYITGGYAAGYSNALLVYNPATNAWTTLAPMTTPRRYHAAGAIGGLIYVAGGYSPSYLNSVEIYDPATNTWSAGPAMPTNWLTAADAVKHDRYLVLAGGSATSTALSTNQGWILDTVTGLWSATPPMPHQLYSAAADGDGTNVWVVSGRLYEGSYSYSPYTTLLLQCAASCTPITTVDFTWDPAVPWAGYDVTFTGTADGTPQIHYAWDLGDGSTGTGPVVVHTYPTTGTYTVVVTATNCDSPTPHVATHNVQVILPPIVDVDPDSLEASQCADEITTQELTICNLGEAPLTWEILERPRAGMDAAPPVNPAPVAERPVITSPDQCAAYENYTGAEPIGAAEFCHPDIAPVPSIALSPDAPTDIGYALDIGYVSDNFVSFFLNDFPGQTVIGTNATAFYGMDFDPTGQTLYALNDVTDELGTIDTATGAFTGLVPCPPGGGAANWTGLSIDPATGVFYGATATDLYTIDPATGATTLVGAFGTTTMIAIAMNMDGEMYGHDITSDSIYSINPATGAATLIGLTGYAANYAQGMDFDNDDGTLYIWLYVGSGVNHYGWVNLTTGLVTPLASSNPQGEFEGAIPPPPEVPWLSEDPITGTIPGGDCDTVVVTFDSTGLTPGDYFADLLVDSNDPATPRVVVPVTLTVEPPLDIVVTAPPLWAELCPDEQQTIDMSICNAGGCDLAWELHEMTPSLTLAGMPFMPVNVTGGGINPGLTAVSPSAKPVAVPPSPEDVLWDQPLSGVNQNAYVNQDFTDLSTYSSFLADDFVNADPWIIESIFVPGNGWNGFTTLMNATGLTWQIYADNAGVPDGDPSGAGNPPVWTLTLPPNDPQVVITNGSGGFPSNVQLNLATPGTLPAGTWWLVFYPSLPFSGGGQYGRQPADTTNGYTGQFVNPGGAFGYGTAWQNWTVLGATQQDIAFRIEGTIDSFAYPDFPWVSEAPTSGVLGLGECVTVSVTFDSTGLTPGDYWADLVILSNDPDTPTITLPMTLTVNAPPDLAVTAPPLEATLCPSETTSLDLNLCNLGECDLVWALYETTTLSLAGMPFGPVDAAGGGMVPRAPAPGASGSRGGSAGADRPIRYNSVASFYEGFDDIALLPGQGWFFQNNSEPLGSTEWFQGNDTVFPAHSGAPTSYIGANYNNTAGVGTISNWMLTPEISLNNGDTISFWTRTPADSTWPDRLELRLSTAGASTNVGVTSLEVGDFTTLLLSVNPDLVIGGYPEEWTQFSATLSGIPAGATGRIAFRYFVTDAGPSGNNSNYIGIDTVEYVSMPGVDVPWLSEDPIAGSLIGGECATVTVTFDATGMAPGTYYASLLLSSNDPDEPEITLPVTMTVNPLPVASFDYAPNAGYLPLPVYFTNTSSDAISPTWDFGDGGTGAGDNVNHTYLAEGTYTVTLTVQSAYGCGESTATAQVLVVSPGLPIPGFESSTPDCLGDTTYFTNTTVGTGTITYAWAFGDGGTSTDENPTHVYAAAGTYTVILTATNAAGSAAISHDVVIGDVPVAGFTFVVAGYDVTFTNASTGATSYLWAFGDTATSTETNPVHTYAANGVYTVTLTAYNDCGEDIFTDLVTIDVGPDMYYVYLPIIVRP